MKNMSDVLTIQKIFHNSNSYLTFRFKALIQDLPGTVSCHFSATVSTKGWWISCYNCWRQRCSIRQIQRFQSRRSQSSVRSLGNPIDKKFKKWTLGRPFMVSIFTDIWCTYIYLYLYWWIYMNEARWLFLR